MVVANDLRRKKMGKRDEADVQIPQPFCKGINKQLLGGVHCIWILTLPTTMKNTHPSKEKRPMLMHVSCFLSNTSK